MELVNLNGASITREAQANQEPVFFGEVSLCYQLCGDSMPAVVRRVFVCVSRFDGKPPSCTRAQSRSDFRRTKGSEVPQA